MQDETTDRVFQPTQKLILGGKKFDTGKPRYDLLPPELAAAVAEILTFGANKYGDRNWEQGMAWGRVYGAAQRHLHNWWSGEAKDAETDCSHLWHAAACLAFLITYEARDVGDDDRPIKRRKTRKDAGIPRS